MEQVKTAEVERRVLAGKRMSVSSRITYGQVFKSLGEMYEDFPSSSGQVNEWLVSLERYSDQTVRLFFTVLKSACKYMEANFELKNPCKAVETPSVMKRKRRYFGVDELMKIIRACKSEVDEALVLTLLDSSCRIGGLSKLKGGDIGDGWFDVKEKTGDRRYRLDVRICGVLKRMAGSEDGLVFAGVSGRGLSMRVIRICRRAGLKGAKLGAHTIRHSSATLVARKTKNVMAVKALLQHDGIQTSMLYVHDVEEEMLKGMTSPLQLVADEARDSSAYKQKLLTEQAGSGKGVGSEVAEVGGFDEVLIDMFPEIKEGVEVRSLLKWEDLMLIRKGFIEMAVSDKYSKDVSRAKDLMRRMLRKVK
ncbi:tyrosine-type recombinase/integrase [Chloroflexota bacterium]